jgi:hypothetical protein
MPTQDSEALTTQSQELMEQADEALDGVLDTALDQYDGKPSEPTESSTEAPSTEEAEPSPEDTPPAEEEAQPRDEMGRFTSKQEVEDGNLDPSEPVPGDKAPVEEPVAEAAPEPEGEVFAFKADHQEFEIPGSTVSEKGLHIPPEQIESVTELMRYGKTHQGSFRTLLASKDAEVKQAQVEREAAYEARSTILSKLAQFTEDPDAFAAWMDNFTQELPILLAKAEAAEAEALRSSDKEKLAALEAEKEWTRMTPQLEDRLEEAIRHFAGQRDLDTDGMRTVWARVREPSQFETIFTRGKDGWQEDFTAVEREVNYLANAIGGRVPKRKEAVKNEAALKPEGKKPPPSAPTKKGPPPKATPKAPQFKTVEEADAFLEEGGYHEYTG